MNIQWYPGHMTKAKRAMQEDIKLIDLIIELVDARAPLSSRNPDIDDLGRGKARMVLLNKADLASEAGNAAWTRYFEAKGFQVMKIDARQKASLKQIHSVIQEACKEKIERDRRRGILNRPVRAMVAGIPNVGKSTFINSFAGKAAAKTGNKPGVTKGNQWIRLNKQVELLDTPGILWPKFEDQSVGLKLAFLGSINDEILNKDELAAELCAFLLKAYPGLLAERYGIPEDQVSPRASGADRHCQVLPLKGRRLRRSQGSKAFAGGFPQRKAGADHTGISGVKEGIYGKNTDRRTAGEGAFTAGGHEGIRKGE